MNKGDRVIVKKHGPGVVVGLWWMHSGGRQLQIADVHLDAVPASRLPVPVSLLDLEGADK